MVLWFRVLPATGYDTSARGGDIAVTVYRDAEGDPDHACPGLSGVPFDKSINDAVLLMDQGLSNACEDSGLSSGLRSGQEHACDARAPSPSGHSDNPLPPH